MTLQAKSIGSTVSPRIVGSVNSKGGWREVKPNYRNFVVSLAVSMVLKRALADRVVLAAAFCVVLFGATPLYDETFDLNP